MKTYGDLTVAQLRELVAMSKRQPITSAGMRDCTIGRNFANAMPELLDQLERMEQLSGAIARRLDKFLNGGRPRSRDLSEIVDKVEHFYKALGEVPLLMCLPSPSVANSRATAATLTADAPYIAEEMRLVDRAGVTRGTVLMANKARPNTTPAPSNYELGTCPTPDGVVHASLRGSNVSLCGKPIDTGSHVDLKRPACLKCVGQHEIEN